MKKVFSKNVWTKFLASMMIVVSLMFLAPEKIEASDGIGGKLAEPIADFVVFVGDGLMDIAHLFVMGQDPSILRLDTEKTIFAIIAGVIVGALVVAGSIALGVVTGGISLIVEVGLVSAALEGVLAVSVIAGVAVGVNVYDMDLWGDIVVMPLYTLSPEEIFEGKLGLFNVNFFDTTLEKEDTLNEDLSEANDGIISGAAKGIFKTSDNGKINIAKELRPTISAWYNTIRTIALVAMLSVLVYMGIRILISSSSTNKAKYKQLIGDWAVGICLLFVMHYGMAFANMFVDKITDVLTATNTESEAISTEEFENALEQSKGNIREQYVELLPYVKNGQDTKIKDAIEELDDDVRPTVGEVGSGSDITLYKEEETGDTYIWWPTNLMGHVRMMASYAKEKNSSYWGYSILFLVLVFYLIFFIWTYLKRVLYMAFLTLIAPFVALTYPLDKVKDGQAQGFNFWFKEYLYNLLLQPLHLLLYTVLITSAMQLAAVNIIYSVVALGFLIPAEKLLKQMFGFKGSTPGSIPGAAGAALAISGINKIFGKTPPHPSNETNENSSSTHSNLGTGDNNPNKYDTLASMLGIGGENSQEITGGADDKEITGGTGDKEITGEASDNENTEGTDGLEETDEADKQGEDSFGNNDRKQVRAKQREQRKQRSRIMARTMLRNGRENFIKGAKKRVIGAPFSGSKKLLKAAVAATAGSVALAATLGSGDGKTVLSSMLGAGALAYKTTGNHIEQQSKKMEHNLDIKNAWENAKDGTMSEEEKREAKAKKLYKDESTQRILDRLTREKREKLMKKTNGKTMLQTMAESKYAKYSNGEDLVKAGLYKLEHPDMSNDTIALLDSTAKHQGNVKVSEMDGTRQEDARKTEYRQINAMTDQEFRKQEEKKAKDRGENLRKKEVKKRINHEVQRNKEEREAKIKKLENSVDSYIDFKI